MVVYKIMEKNKLFRRVQLANFPNVFQPPAETKDRWHDIFGNHNPITLELACGAGAYTLALATMYPQRNFVGVDVKGVRLWHGAKTALEEGLQNVAFLRIPIERLEDYFLPHQQKIINLKSSIINQVTDIWLTFPDPFPKKRHAKHRLIHPRFLEIYKKILAPGGVLHLKTDDLNLFNYSVETLLEANWRVSEIINNIYANNRMSCQRMLASRNNVNEVLDIQTVYEKKYLAQGRQIHNLKAVR